MSYEDRWGQYYKGAGDTFPQGIGSIAGYLEKHGFPVTLLEPDIEGFDLKRMEQFLREGQFDIIGISAFTTTIHLVYRTASLIKRIRAATSVVVGGAHPTIFPEHTLEECAEIDYVITHEGEKPFLELLCAFQQGLPLADVSNLYYREKDAIQHSLKTAQWLDLDELPLFPYHLFDLSKYVPAPSLRRVLPTFNYMAQRGCPYDCSFCSTLTHGRKVRYRSVHRVIEDLKILKRDFSVRGLIFEGSNFTAKTSWVEELCQCMINESLKLSWYAMGRVDLEQRLLPLMKKAGLWCMSFGIESANPTTLAKMNKKIDPAQVKETLTLLKRLNVRSIGSFILGYPGETEEDVKRTIDWACELPLDVAVFFIPVPFPQTKLYIDVVESGGLKENLSWEDYHAWLDHNHPIYINPQLGEKHVALYNEAFRRFYMRPRYIVKQLGSIHSWADVARLFQGFKSVGGLIKKSVFGKFRSTGEQ